MAEGYTEAFVEVAETKLHLLRGGQGEPLLILHSAGGNRGWLAFAQLLAQRFEVYVPDHPGFGKSDQPEWITSVPDLACFYLWALEDLGLSRLRVLGLSLGGWLAAEMAVMCPHLFERLILVGAAGVKPTQGEITDIFLLSPAELTAKLFHDPKQGQSMSSYTARRQLLKSKICSPAIMRWRPASPGSPICMTRACRPCCVACICRH